MEESIGQITSGLEFDTLVLKTMDFVLEQLPAWRDDPDRPNELSEPQLNQQLCKFLDSQARNIFPMVRFDHEENEPNRRRVDLAASPVEKGVIGARPYTIYDHFLVFECKRLPAPSRDRKMEYVTGGKKDRSGGIQRFKLGLHGAKLNLVAMIGYIQKLGIQDWHHEINNWILELSSGAIEDYCRWEETEKLQDFNENAKQGTSVCQSIHKRTGGSTYEVTIYHLWVIMNIKESRERI
jgi:hypothetical protein